MSIRTVTAHEWTCDTCHDTGYARTEAAAGVELADHRADYHGDPEPLDADEFDAEHDWAGDLVG